MNKSFNMTLEEVKKFIPSSFRIACHTINVRIENQGEDYGEFDSLRNTITLYLEIKDDNSNYVKQTAEQLLNSYFHELYHVFNFFYNTEMDEALAQTFANFTCEYIETKTNN